MSASNCKDFKQRIGLSVGQNLYSCKVAEKANHIQKIKILLLKCGFSEEVDSTVTGCHGISGTIKTNLTLICTFSDFPVQSKIVCCSNLSGFGCIAAK